MIYYVHNTSSNARNYIVANMIVTGNFHLTITNLDELFSFLLRNTNATNALILIALIPDLLWI